MTEQVQEAEATNDNEAAVERRKAEVPIYSVPCDLRPDESE